VERAEAGQRGLAQQRRHHGVGGGLHAVQRHHRASAGRAPGVGGAPVPGSAPPATGTSGTAGSLGGATGAGSGGGGGGAVSPAVRSGSVAPSGGGGGAGVIGGGGATGGVSAAAAARH
jgi:hypothetical protein